MLIALLRRKGLKVEFDGLSNVGDGFFQRVPLGLTSLELWAPCVEAMLVLLDDRARFTDHAPSLAYPQPNSATSSCLKSVNAVKVGGVRTSRRAFLASSLLSPVLLKLRGAPHVPVTGLELIPVRASERTVWLVVRLSTDRGLTGLGEASDAFGFANTTKQDAVRMESELRKFFGLIQGKSPLDVESYRQRAEPIAAAGGLVSATAYSAIEQALWDLAGQSLDIPAYDLFGGKVRDGLTVYANINRATKLRTPQGFAATAKRAVGEGFRAIKGAPFDGFPKPGSARLKSLRQSTWESPASPPCARPAGRMWN